MINVLKVTRINLILSLSLSLGKYNYLSGRVEKPDYVVVLIVPQIEWNLIKEFKKQTKFFQKKFNFLLSYILIQR